MKYDRISADKFRQRIQDNFSAAFLTLISIIQGVAFAILFTQLDDLLNHEKFELLYLIYPAFSFLTIIFVFFSYSWFVSAVFTPPDFHESAIPLILAATQIFPMYFFDDPEKWWLMMSIFFAFASVSYTNTLFILKQNLYDDDFASARNILRFEIVTNLVSCAVLSMIAFSAYRKMNINGNEIGADVGHAIVLIVIIVIMGIKSQVKTLNSLYRLAGF